MAGVWATPPFLHNGSVPSVYQLLSPQDERATTFYKGTFEYDPRHLGYRTDKGLAKPTSWKDLADPKLAGSRGFGGDS